MATFTATTAADEAFDGETLATEAADGTGLSLREALALANDAVGEDTIAFDPSLNGAVLRLTAGTLGVRDDGILDGTMAGTSGVILSGDAHGDDRDAAGAIGAAGTGITDLDNSAGYLGDNRRILATSNSAVEVIGLALNGGVTDRSGGAIASTLGDITLTGSTVPGNRGELQWWTYKCRPKWY